jgi:hypothetical protein
MSTFGRRSVSGNLVLHILCRHLIFYKFMMLKLLMYWKGLTVLYLLSCRLTCWSMTFQTHHCWLLPFHITLAQGMITITKFLNVNTWLLLFLYIPSKKYILTLTYLFDCMKWCNYCNASEINSKMHRDFAKLFGYCICLFK